MPDYSQSQLDAIQAGQATFDGIAKIANAARNAACSFYKNFPDQLRSNDPGSQFIGGIWDGFCGGGAPGLPPPPSLGFPGGQCHTLYNWNFWTKRLDRQGARTYPFTSGGPLSDFQVTGIINTDNSYNPPARQWSCQFKDGNGTIVGGSTVGDRDGDYPFFIVQRADGLADNCGDNPGGFPPSTSPPPGTSEPGGGTSFNIGPISYQRNDGIVVNFPAKLVLGGLQSPGQIVVGVAANLNANININLGGVHVNFGGGVAPGGGNGGSGGNNGSLGDIVDRILKNTEPPPPPGAPNVKPPEDQPTDQPPKKGVVGLISVIANVTVPPSKAKVQFGNKGPDKLYAGWFEWYQGNHPLGRQPIDFDGQIFFTPKGCDGYSYTFTNNANGFFTEIKGIIS